jgi:acyl carrier protein
VPNVIAVIGLAGRFPGEESIEIRRRPAGAPSLPAAPPAPSPAAVLGGGGAGWISPTRAFIACAQEALVNAGHATRLDAERTALFRGVDGAAGDTGGAFGGGTFGDDDPASEAAGELGLRGPAASVANPTSPALGAVVGACASLRSGECDLALAGAVSLAGDEVCVLALKRLPLALADGDRVLAIVLGTALHDGSAGDEDAGGLVREALGGVPLAGFGRVEACVVGDAGERQRAIAGLEAALDAAEGGGAAHIAIEGRAASEGAAGIGRLVDAVLAVERGGHEEQGSGAAERRVLVAGLGERGAAFVGLEAAPPAAPQMGAAVETAPVGRERPVLGTAYAPPTNGLEEAIAGIWQAQLGIERIGIDDNFFELGGTSIVGVQIVNVLKEWLHQDIPTVSLYEGPTVSALTRVLLHTGPPKGYDAVRERGERRRRKLQRGG